MVSANRFASYLGSEGLITLKDSRGDEVWLQGAMLLLPIVGATSPALVATATAFMPVKYPAETGRRVGVLRPRCRDIFGLLAVPAAGCGGQTSMGRGRAALRNEPGGWLSRALRSYCATAILLGKLAYICCGTMLRKGQLSVKLP